MKIKMENLVFDEKLLKLRPINSIFVSRYRQAYRSGNDLGKLLVDRKTKRIISGNHRGTALLEEYGPEHVIDVELGDFTTEQAVLERFVKENIAHGNALTGSSRRAIAQELIKEGATPEHIANLFGVAVKRIDDWAGVTVMVIGGKGGKSESLPAKRGIQPGTTMNKSEYQTHWKEDRGISVFSQAEQLTRWLENGWIDRNCDRTVVALSDLYNALGTFLENRKVA